MHRIAVAGNPNSGKTSLFNNLTGGLQRVGNYPGVTVEYVEGTMEYNKEQYTFIDLPGTYSLTAYSQEELVARDFIIKEKPAVIVNVVDASNLERNLYLTTQLIELNIPIVIALNMVDVAEKKGHHIDATRLGELLGLRVVSTVATKGKGKAELIEACVEAIEKKVLPSPLSYSHELNSVLSNLEKSISETDIFQNDFPSRWLALKLLEDDDEVLNILKNGEKGKSKVENQLKKAKAFLLSHSDEDSTTAVAEGRYGFANGAARECVKMSEVKRRMLTDKIDAVVCNRFLGPIIFLCVVYMLFIFVFNLSSEINWIPLFNGEFTSPVGVFVLFFEFLSKVAHTHISSEWLLSLVNDGIIGGVGGVMGFVPIIFFMFLFIAFLEDSGYVARIAFILDRILRSFGLQGKSILAMIVSGGLGAGGCAVPGILATRTLREEKDRLVTILVAPLMNCGAKMPVYTMLITAFFAKSRGEMMFLLWGISWLFALMSAFIIRKFVVRGEQTPFVMELPVYHIPTLKGVLMHTWNRTWMYMKKAGTIILAINLIIWALMYYPRYNSKPFDERRAAEFNILQVEFALMGIEVNSADDANKLLKLYMKQKEADNDEELAAIKSKLNTDELAFTSKIFNEPNLRKVSDSYLKNVKQLAYDEAACQLSNSFAGIMGRALVPVSKFAGFDWRDNIALIGGFAAKEVVLGTLGTAYSMGEIDPDESEPLAYRLRSDDDWSKLRAFALIIFVMLYAPCFVTVATIRKETGSWKWAAFSTAYSTALGAIFATLIYQIGSLIG